MCLRASRRSPHYTDQTKVAQTEDNEKKKEILKATDLMNQKLEEMQQEAKTAKVVASYLFAQHAEASRDKAEKVLEQHHTHIHVFTHLHSHTYTYNIYRHISLHISYIYTRTHDFLYT